MSRPIQYAIEPVDPDAHLFRVTVTVSDPDPAGELLRLPAWIPGSYLVRDFARNVVDVSANCGGASIEMLKVDKASWQTGACDGTLNATFDIYAWDLSVRGAHLDRRHAYFNGACVFPAVAGREDDPCMLDIRAPSGGLGDDWRVATAMRPVSAERFGYGVYLVDDYWELIDHPVEIGDVVIGEFEVADVPHTLAVRGHERVDIARICRDLEAVCAVHHRLFGTPPGLDRYLFLLTVVDEGYGGLEHRWSSSNMCSRDDLPATSDTEVSNGYRKLLGLFSHEYFHLWNVTRMKPAAFTPYDLSREAYTGLLWVFEGITSYYDDLALARSGVVSHESYLELLGQTITRVLRAPGRRRQSIEESSFDAWTKFYRQDAGSPNFIVSYYQKGSLVALALDLTIRRMSDDTFSLDDVMRACWERYGESGQGMPERGIETVAREVCNLDLASFFERYVRGTAELSLDELLLNAGVRMHFRAATGSSDAGGKPADDSATPLPWFGSKLASADGRDRFGTVIAGSPAERAGLAPGDEAVALDGLRIDAGNFDRRLRACAAGSDVRLTVFRRDELLELEVRLADAPKDTCWLTLDEDPSPVAAARRDSWLSGDS
ncbi:MAG: PDZ domain-containing protein [Woeseiaceae bacterium]|nr:PDZ domain-containing protein [Woeseiaceae bacterium]